MLDFTKCRFDDAEITAIRLLPDQVIVVYRDWQEKEHDLVFDGVVGYQAFSPEMKALSHGLVSQGDAFIKMACVLAEEDDDAAYSLYSFVSVWSDEPILKIVAKSVQSL